MATSTISNTILDPTGTAIASVPVTVRLMPSGGFRVDTFTEVARLESTTTNASGVWSLALERNSNITPGGTSTWYEVTEFVPDSAGGKRVWTIQVGASDQSLLASLVTPADHQPTVVPAGTTYISQAAGDARYQAVGSLGSGTPGTETPDHAGTAGVATSASRSDHIHPITAATPVVVPLAGDAALSEGVAATFARSDHAHAADNLAWSTWSPTFTNFTLGNGSVVARYIRIGRTINWRMRITLGTTSAMGSDPKFTLPVAPVAGYSGASDIMGQVNIQDNGTANFHGQVWFFTGSTAQLVVNNGASGAAALITATVPMTWAATDQIGATGFYEAAT